MSAREVSKSIIRFFVRFLFPYKAIGLENFPTEESGIPTVLCCNHVSMMDPVHLLACQKRHIFFMGKEELFRSRLGRWFFGKLMGVFAVNRGKGDVQAIQTAINIVKDGRVMGIFPEGTRSRDGQLGRGKAGAALVVAKTGASVLPCCVIRKNMKLRLFSRTTVVFGTLISPEELHLDGEKPDLRYASRLIMSRIGELIEANR